jgi:ferredoxin-NADP reductase/ferredoxin
VVPETASVSSIQLAAPDGSALPPALAGQYITVRITREGAPAIVRSYSLSSPPGASAYRISVKREPHGAASGYLHDTLAAGAMLEVAAPRGEFTLDPAESGPVLLISAGIGVTPVLAMLQQLAAARAGRQVWWIHAARGPREHPFAAEARSLLASLPDARERVFYSAATGQEARDGGATRGRLTAAALAGLGLPGDATAYLCGPAGFMAGLRPALAAAGLDPARIRTEVFGALDAITPGVVGQARRAPHPPDGQGAGGTRPGTGPQVTFARSGISAPFALPGAATLLELADACDVPARWACRTGVCHTCVTPLLSGDVAYAPAPLEPPAAGQVLICCARPVTDVVLDM